MFYRLSSVGVCAATLTWLVWNAWFRESVSGDAVVGEALLAVYITGTAAVAALFVMLFPGYRPQDRYWGFATLGLVIGFWMQR